MADRYLLLSVGAAAVGAAWLARNELALALFAFAAAALAIATERRAVLFSDSVALFEDATAKTRESPVAPYQLGQALEARASWASAAGAYREALRRASSDAELGRRATNGLAHAYVNGGNLADAEQVLLSGRVRWPKDPKMLVNLAVVTGALGKKPQARQLYLELKRDFPKYAAELEAELEQGRGAH
jgi:tetratricopeptide (TPR) repeat protein